MITFVLSISRFGYVRGDLLLGCVAPFWVALFCLFWILSVGKVIFAVSFFMFASLGGRFGSFLGQYRSGGAPGEARPPEVIF